MSKVFIVPGEVRTQYVTREVHEHRAPTDQSVALLREMEAASEAKRIASVHLEGNALKGLVQAFRRTDDGTIRFVVLIGLNGERIEVRHTASEFDSGDKIMADLRDEIARRLAAEVVAPSLPGLARVLPR